MHLGSFKIEKIVRRLGYLTALAIVSQVLALPCTTSVSLRTPLTGAAIGGVTPSGTADARCNPNQDNQLRLQASNVNLPNGTVLTVVLRPDGQGDPVVLGTFTLTGGSGKFEVKGPKVPETFPGDHIGVFNGTTQILAGVFTAN